MKHLLLWISICLLVPLTLIATQGHVSASPSATPVPTQAAITPTLVVPISTSVRAADGAVMVYVPAGEFLMGSRLPEGYSNERPQHAVYLDAYWIDRTEVTNQQFEKFVKATGYRTDAEKQGSGSVLRVHSMTLPKAGADWRHPEGPDSSLAGRADYPVVQVSWNDGMAYCQWAGARLPTVAQWQKAARGTDERRYAWGNQEPSCQYAVMADDRGDGCGQGSKPWPVGSKPEGASPYGVLDMGGNVWKWLADYYDKTYFAHSPASNPQGPEKGTLVTEQCGSWADDLAIARDWFRLGCILYDVPDYKDNAQGFRCAVSVPAPAAPAELATTPAAPGPASRVLFIGDSDSRFLDRYLPRLAASADPPISVQSKAFATGGALLGIYFEIPGQRYPIEEIRSGNWNVVILGQDLHSSWRVADTFCDYAHKFQQETKKADAEAILYMPWDNVSVPPPPTLKDTADIYTKCGAELGVKVAPVGLAFERAIKERPSISLYASDGAHANLRGLYLALGVLYATIYDRNPVGLAYRMGDVAAWSLEYSLWGLDRQKDWQLTDDEATFLQQVAWETVQDYQAGK